MGKKEEVEKGEEQRERKTFCVNWHLDQQRATFECRQKGEKRWEEEREEEEKIKYLRDKETEK